MQKFCSMRCYFYKLNGTGNQTIDKRFAIAEGASTNIASVIRTMAVVFSITSQRPVA